MAKKIDTTVVLKDFEGKPLKDEGKELTLKAVLLNYLQNANMMGLTSDHEKSSAYLAGLAIGTGGDVASLEQSQYDVIKKLVDGNTITVGNQSTELYRIIVQQQVKKIIDEAPSEK